MGGHDITLHAVASPGRQLRLLREGMNDSWQDWNVAAQALGQALGVLPEQSDAGGEDTWVMWTTSNVAAEKFEGWLQVLSAEDMPLIYDEEEDLFKWRGQTTSFQGKSLVELLGESDKSIAGLKRWMQDPLLVSYGYNPPQGCLEH